LILAAAEAKLGHLDRAAAAMAEFRSSLPQVTIRRMVFHDLARGDDGLQRFWIVGDNGGRRRLMSTMQGAK